jgi:uncharacterized membrane protein
MHMPPWTPVHAVQRRTAETWEMSGTHGAERGLQRFEGFTDAVFAIALTLLIVEIKPPGAPDGPQADGSLFQAMMSQWREMLALLLSFLAIGVYWLCHHYSGRVYAKTDYVFSVINLGFLLAVTVLPYPLRIWCFHVGTDHERTASVVFTIGLFLPAFFWMLKWLYARPRYRLIDKKLAPDFVDQLTRRWSAATIGYFVAVLVALFLPRVGVALSIAVIASFLLPQPKPRYLDGQEPEEEEDGAELERSRQRSKRPTRGRMRHPRI